MQMLHCTDLALRQVHQPETFPMFARFTVNYRFGKHRSQFFTTKQQYHKAGTAHISRIYSSGEVSSGRQRPLTQRTD